MRSIRIKLWAGMMTLVIIVLILLWLFQIVFLENFYTRMKVNDIKEKTIAVTELLNADKTEDFRDQMDILAYENSMSIELLDMNGNIIYETNSSGTVGKMHGMMNSLRSQIYEKALTGQESATTMTHPRFGNEFMLIGLPVYINQELTGGLLLSFPLAPVEDTAAILQRQLFYISLILLAAASLLSFLLARTFTRPIVDIEKAAAQMAEGDFSARIDVKQQDEIGQLAKTINYLGQQLSQIDQMRKDLIANVSHELRTPLSLIRGYAETLRDVTGNDEDKRQKQLGVIIEEAERLSRMVDDILNLSRLQSGHFELNKSIFSVRNLAGNVAKRYDLLSKQREVSIIMEMSDEQLVEADAARIEQVLYNLINNAFNNTNAGGTITIRDMDNGDSVRIEVMDSGSGIPEEEINRIWDRYYKADKNIGKTMGSGLGLAIVKAILEAHGAAYGVESKKGVGTTFWFELTQG
ncbi:MAG: cell wall metabolism sensor histidine kinase WalK [Syntrophomonadaceae bacterium]|nr:cell wall metabolism sensor histidine kinase WalK [Syntrophomonadaceae bacterium]